MPGFSGVLLLEHRVGRSLRVKRASVARSPEPSLGSTEHELPDRPTRPADMRQVDGSFRPASGRN